MILDFVDFFIVPSFKCRFVSTLFINKINIIIRNNSRYYNYTLISAVSLCKISYLLFEKAEKHV